MNTNKPSRADKSKVTVTETASLSSTRADEYDGLPKDHPVHKIPVEEREKMRKKGVNPVLKAEMDETLGRSKEGKFWVKFGLNSGLRL
jgi:hypothetical protein